jgi:hypothetical protein
MEGVGTGMRVDVGKKVDSRMKTVQIMCIHVCKCKNDTCLNCSRNRGGGIQESYRGGKFKNDIFDAL